MKCQPDVGRLQCGLLLTFEVTDWVLERVLGLRPLPSLATVPVERAHPTEFAGEYALPDGLESIWIHEEDGGLRLVTSSPLLVPEQTAVELPLRTFGEDLAIAEFMGVPLFTDFVRDNSGKVA